MVKKKISKSESLGESFGAQQVSSDERTRRIRKVFKSVAPRYDLMNDFMSMGIHRLWKSYLVKQFETKDKLDIVDLAGGTGDIARAIAKRYEHHVIIMDPSLEMMQVGNQREGESPIACIAATGENIPLKDNSFDALTISFGIRNFTHMQTGLKEIYRILKPGAKFYCLEFSKPLALIRPFYQLYNRWVIPRLGAAIAKEPEAYQYLIESIQRFPDQKEMASLMSDAGFSTVSYKNLSFGIACLHIAQK